MIWAKNYRKNDIVGKMRMGQLKSMEYTLWFWTILTYLLNTHLLLESDQDCSKTKFEKDENLIWTETFRKMDIVGKMRMGPTSAKKHGVHPMRLDNFDLLIKDAPSS